MCLFSYVFLYFGIFYVLNSLLLLIQPFRRMSATSSTILTITNNNEESPPPPPPPDISPHPLSHNVTGHYKHLLLILN